MDKKEIIENLESNFHIMNMFDQVDLLEVLLLNDLDELNRMREFYNSQKIKLSEIKNTIKNSVDDNEIIEIVGKFRRDIYNEGREPKAYVVKEGVVKKIVHSIKRRGKK